MHNLQLKKTEKLSFIFETKYIAFTSAFITIATFQDYLQAFRRGGAFYISESLLFNSYWLCFIPVCAILIMFFRKGNSAQTSVLAKKTVVFILSGFIMHLLLYSALVFCISAAFYDGTYGFFKVMLYSLSTDLYIYILAYGILAFTLIRQKKENALQENHFEPLQNICIKTGRNTVVIPSEEIISIHANSPYINICTKDRVYLHSETLKSISNKLNQGQFLRIHKSTLVNAKHIKSITSRLNGDYDVMMENGCKHRLSRTFVPKLKEILKAGHQVAV